MVSSGTLTKMLLTSFYRFSLMKPGNWIWNVLLISAFGVRISIMFSDLTMFDLSKICCLSLNMVMSLVKIIRRPLEGDSTERSLVMLAAI